MKSALLFVSIVCVGMVSAQQNLLDEMEDSNEPAYVTSTFKGTRVVNGHSVETRPGGILEFSIMHRFGTLNSGGYELWGLDYSTIRLGLEYSISDRLVLAIGRSSFDKSYDTYLKYKALRQAKGISVVTITGLAGMAYNSSMPKNESDVSNSDAMAYSAQLLIARKFSQRFSIQVSPTMIHRNRVDQSAEVNTLYSIGLAARVSITRSFSINTEYYPRLNEHDENPNFNALGFALEFETGGHVFQLIFTNSLGMMERRMVAETEDDFFSGDIHFGFNITRTFQLAGKR